MSMVDEETRAMTLLVVRTSFGDLREGNIELGVSGDLKLTELQQKELDVLMVEVGKILIQGIQNAINLEVTK